MDRLHPTCQLFSHLLRAALKWVYTCCATAEKEDKNAIEQNSALHCADCSMLGKHKHSYIKEILWFIILLKVGFLPPHRCYKEELKG